MDNQNIALPASERSVPARDLDRVPGLHGRREDGRPADGGSLNAKRTESQPPLSALMAAAVRLDEPLRDRQP